jgi:hypothetical protein
MEIYYQYFGTRIAVMLSTSGYGQGNIYLLIRWYKGARSAVCLATMLM